MHSNNIEVTNEYLENFDALRCVVLRVVCYVILCIVVREIPATNQHTHNGNIMYATSTEQ